MHPDPGPSTQATARISRRQSKPAQMYKFYPVFQIDRGWKKHLVSPTPERVQ